MRSSSPGGCGDRGASSSSRATAASTRRSTALRAGRRSASSPAAGRACSRARSACRAIRSRRRERIAARPDADDLARPRERAPLRVRAGDRARRRARAARRRARPRREREAARRPGVRVDGAEDARRAPRPLRAGARAASGTAGPRSRSSRTADPYSYVGRLPLRLPRGARFEGGLDALAPRERSPAPPARRRSATSPRGGPACRSCSLHDCDRIERALRRADAAPARRRGSSAT